MTTAAPRVRARAHRGGRAAQDRSTTPCPPAWSRRRHASAPVCASPLHGRRCGGWVVDGPAVDRTPAGVDAVDLAAEVVARAGARPRPSSTWPSGRPGAGPARRRSSSARPRRHGDRACAARRRLASPCVTGRRRRTRRSRARRPMVGGPRRARAGSTIVRLPPATDLIDLVLAVVDDSAARGPRRQRRSCSCPRPVGPSASCARLVRRGYRGHDGLGPGQGGLAGGGRQPGRRLGPAAAPGRRRRARRARRAPTARRARPPTARSTWCANVRAGRASRAS